MRAAQVERIVAAPSDTATTKATAPIDPTRAWPMKIQRVTDWWRLPDSLAGTRRWKAAASINVAPTTLSVGGTVTVSGDVLGPDGQPGCQLPETVMLISGAFAGHGSFTNQDVETMVGVDGKYSVSATIPSGVVPGSYTIRGRCGGGNLGVQATLIVTP